MSINKENVKDIKLIDKIIDGTQNIAYDNTTSGLSASTLKDAIDEVKALADVPAQVVTSLTLQGNTLTYLDENLNQTNINLGQYLDNTDKFVVSGSVQGTSLVLTLNDSSTININVSSLLDNTDKFVTSGSVNGGTLTLVRNDSSTVDISVQSLLDNTNTYVVSGSVSGNTLTLTNNDNSHVNINVQSLLDNTDKFVTSGSVSQNTLTLNLNDGSTVSINIAGIQNTTVNTSKIQFDLTGPSTPLTVGGLAWNSAEQTLDIACNGATLQIGQEQLILVRNNTGSIIPNGTVLMATGSLGNSTRITVAPHNGQQAYARYIVGVATETIAVGADGFATTFGKVRQINTSGSNVGETWTDGTVLYVKPNGSGALTSADPTTSQLSMPIAFVLNAHGSNGTIFVRVLPLDEHGFIPHAQTMIDAAITALVNGAPAALNTLKELADALGNDANFATTMANTLALKANLAGADFTGNVTTTGSLKANNGVLIKDTVPVGQTLTIPAGYQMVVDHLDVQGTLDIQGTLATTTGGYLNQTTMKTAVIQNPVQGNGLTINENTTVSGTVQATTALLNTTNDSTTVVSGLQISNPSTVNGSRAGITFRNYDNWGAHIYSPRTGSTAGSLVIGTSSSDGDISAASITDRVIVDFGGRVSMPYQPAFHAIGNTGRTTIASGGQFMLGVTTSNIGNCYSTSTGRFTAPIAGYYVFQYGIYSYVTGQLAIKKNGGDWIPSDTSGLCTVQNDTINSASMGMYLNSGDYVSFGFRNGSSGDVYTSHAWLSGHLVG